MAVNTYPLDFDALVKGQFISNERLEEILGIPRRDENRFRCAVLDLQGRIQQRGFTVRIDWATGLYILKDVDAIQHNDRLFNQYKRGMATRHRLSIAIDVEALTSQQRAQHDRNLLRQGRLLQAMTQETRSYRLEKRRNRGDLLFGEIERGHSFVRTTYPKKSPQLLSSPVRSHNRGLR